MTGGRESWVPGFNSAWVSSLASIIPRLPHLTSLRFQRNFNFICYNNSSNAARVLFNIALHHHHYLDDLKLTLTSAAVAIQHTALVIEMYRHSNFFHSSTATSRVAVNHYESNHKRTKVRGSSRREAGRGQAELPVTHR